MTKPNGNPCAGLQKLFHEPNRLSIMSALCGGTPGLSFKELKRKCELTDGNLSRHLAALGEAGAVRVEKAFVGRKPRTTVFATDFGRDGFVEYLRALEIVLHNALEAVEMPRGVREWQQKAEPAFSDSRVKGRVA